MANRKALLIGAGVVVFALLIGFYWMKSSPNSGTQQQGTTAVETDIGVIDMKRAMRAHPDYVKLTQLKKERSALAADAEDTRDFIAESTMPSVDLAGLEGGAIQQRNQKIAVKQAALNERLKQKEQALKTEFSGQYGAEIKEIDDMYLPQIFNLQLKLDTLRIEKEAAVQILGQINALKKEHSEKVRDNREKFMKQIGAVMKAEQDKALQELQKYAASVDKELGADVRKKQAEIETRNHLAMGQKTNEFKLGMTNSLDLQKRLADKEKAYIDLQEAIQKDISGKIAKIAVERKLTTVLDSVRVNVKALDITEMVIEAFKK